MTQNMRTGLGLLAVALIALIIGLAADTTLALVAAGWCALFGLGLLALDLLRPAGGSHTKSSSGERSSGDT